MWLNRELTCRDYGLLLPNVAGRRWSLAPNLAPREPLSEANVRELELIVDSSCITVTLQALATKARSPSGGREPNASMMLLGGGGRWLLVGLFSARASNCRSRSW